MKLFKILSIAIIFSLLLFSCLGSGLKGTYVVQNNAFFEKLTFKSGHKVDIVFMGTTSEIEYELDGNKVKITNAGQNQILTITDDGCLDGGGIVGKYCKE